MDAILLNSEESMSKQTMYNIPATSTYVTDRQKVSFFPSGSSSFESTGGSRLMRFHLGGNNWLDPASLSLQFNVKATSAFVKPLTAWGFVKRCRVLLKGNVISDIDNFNRVEEILNITESKNYYNNQLAKGCLLPKPNPLGVFTNYADTEYDGLADTVSKTFVLKLPGLFKTATLLPLQYLDAVIEIELISDFTDGIITVATGGDFVYTTNTPSGTAYTIEKPVIRCDVCAIDSEVENEFVMHLLNGNSMNIPFENYAETTQTLGGSDVQVSVSRSLTKLKRIYVTYELALTGGRAVYRYKPWNALYCPRGGTATNEVLNPAGLDEPIQKLQIQVGSKLYPNYQVSSLAECYEQLQLCFGKDVGIDFIEFCNEKFIFAINFEKLEDVNFTGINTKNSPIVINSKTSSAASQMHILFAYDSIIEIRDTGVSVYD